VVVFVTGGMWIIGYKAWGALLARCLMERGILVCCLDYRNFPQGTVGEMVADVGSGIAWVMQNCAEYGGDPNRVTVVGQSAGAHLSALAILRQAEWEASGGTWSEAPWPVSRLHAFIGVSGVYEPDNRDFVEHMNAKGLYREVFWSIMEAGLSGARANEALPRASPVAIARKPAFTQSRAPSLLPPITLLHGDKDQSALPSGSKAFAAALRDAKVAIVERYYTGKSHTDPFVEDPISGGKDLLLQDIISTVFGTPQEIPTRKRMIPSVLIALARWCIPF